MSHEESTCTRSITIVPVLLQTSLIIENLLHHCILLVHFHMFQNRQMVVCTSLQMDHNGLGIHCLKIDL